MLMPNFVGPSYRARSGTIASDALGNLFAELSENAADIKAATYYGTPGCKLIFAVGSNSYRGGFSQDGRTFVVVGGFVYELDQALTMIIRQWAVANDGLPVFFATNGRGGEQLAILSAGVLQVIKLTTNVISGAITLPLTNPGIALDFMDGYFLLAEANTIRVWFSNLENGLLWDALDFFAVSLTSSNVVGLKVYRDRCWVFQSQSALVYYDSGNTDNPFVPYPGSVMQEGAVNATCITVLGEAIYWLGSDNQGRHRMVTAQDYSPTVISTPPISFALASYTTTADAEVFAYEQEGHPFVGWTFPAGSTWCYDTRTQQWHERYGWNDQTGQRTRWRSRGVCNVGEMLLTGDFETGALYALDMDTFTDNGDTIQRLRRAPYLSGENQWLFLDRAELGIQSGVGNAAIPAPLAQLELSRDGGNTWTPPITATMGAVGQYLNRCIWRRLGRARADRLVIQVTSTDPVRQVWGPGLWLTTRAGSGGL